MDMKKILVVDDSAIHMAKCRAVNPEMISNQRWLSGIFPLMEYKDKSNN